MERENNILAFDAAITARRIDENGFMHVDACHIISTFYQGTQALHGEIGSAHIYDS